MEWKINVVLNKCFLVLLVYNNNILNWSLDFVIDGVISI